jgi:hypothetical protein
MAKGDSGLSYSRIDEIPDSHLTETENCKKVSLLDKAILQIFNLLKMVLCSFCDGVTLKFKEENRRASNLPAQTI